MDTSRIYIDAVCADGTGEQFVISDYSDVDFNDHCVIGLIPVDDYNDVEDNYDVVVRKYFLPDFLKSFKYICDWDEL